MTTDSDTTTDVVRRQFYVAGGCLAALIHVILAVFFYIVGEPTIAHWDVAAVCVHLIGAAYSWRGRLLLGTWIVAGSAIIHTTFLVVALGPESGFGYYIWPWPAVVMYSSGRTPGTWPP